MLRRSRPKVGDVDVSALIALLGVGIAFSLTEINEGFLPLIGAFAAGNFIYLACADIVPELFRTKDARRSLIQIAGIAVGLLAMYLLLGLE